MGEVVFFSIVEMTFSGESTVPVALMCTWEA